MANKAAAALTPSAKTHAGTENVRAGKAKNGLSGLAAEKFIDGVDGIDGERQESSIPAIGRQFA